MNSSASKYYDLLAKFYEQATSADGAWTPPQMIKKFVGDNISHNSLVLDVGIGTGQSSAFLKDHPNKPGIYGIDISTEMLKICKQNHPAISIYNGTLENFTAQNNLKFNLVISSGAFEFIEDLSSAFKCIQTLLSDSGRFIFTFEPLIINHPIQSVSKSLVVNNSKSSLYVEGFYTYRRTFEEVQELLKQTGFKLGRMEDFNAYQKEGNAIVYNIIEAFIIPKLPQNQI